MWVIDCCNFQNDDEETSSSTRSSREKAKKDLFKQTSPDSSTDSDFDDQDSSYGPTTRKAWSDLYSIKGKSSQSEDDTPTKVSNCNFAKQYIFYTWYLEKIVVVLI